MAKLAEKSSFSKSPGRVFLRRPGHSAKSQGNRSEEPSIKAAPPQRQTLETETGRQIRILVVDDQQLLVDLMTAMLGRLGYEVIRAANGQEAVEAARTFEGRIDGILLDVSMPVMDGIHALPLLQEARPGVPTVLCSGNAPDGATRAILDAGTAGFIKKPFDLHELGDELRRALRSSPVAAPRNAEAIPG